MVTSLPGYLLSRVDRSRTDDSRARDVWVRMGFGLSPLALRARAGHAARVVLRMASSSIPSAPVPGPPDRHRVFRPRPGGPRRARTAITHRLCTIAGFY